MGSILAERVMDQSITITNRELFSTSPDLRRALKEQVTTRKLPPHVKAGAAYVTTDAREQFQQSYEVHQVFEQLVVAKDSHALRAITPVIEGLHEVECLLDNGSQIVSMSEAVWRYIKKELNPDHKITLQSANGTRDLSLGIVENLELEIGGMKLYVQAHVIRDAAYDILLGRPFDVLTASTVENHRDATQDITLHDPNSDKTAKIHTQPRGQPRFKMQRPEDSSF